MRLTSILSEAVRTCIRRFPVPAAFATALAALLIGMTVSEKDNDLTSAIGYFLSVGFVLSLSLSLWSEERLGDSVVGQSSAMTDPSQPNGRPLILTVWGLSFLILLADTIYIYHCGSHWSLSVSLMHASAILALTLSVFFLSFMRERDDIPAWNFALRLVVSAVVCGLVGMVLWGGLSLLSVSLKWLFSINFGYKWYLVLGTLFGGWLSSMLFLGSIPSGDGKHNRTPLSSKFLNGVIRYLFVPLELLYLAVLLIYAILILVRWELPNGMVSWLVIASFAGMVGIVFGIYPALKSEGRRFDQAVVRWLPLVLTPLLLLMTVGIVRRFSDYGITVPRLYLATLNGWFYAVCIGLVLTRARRIHWIPISFAALFLLTSVLPLNYATLTRRVLMRQTTHALTKAGATALPLNAEQFDALMKSLPADEASRICAKLEYLEKTFRSKTIEPIVTQKEKAIFFHEYITDVNASDDEAISPKTIFQGSATLGHIHIPEGYSELYANVHGDLRNFDAKVKTVEVTVEAEGKTLDTLVVELSQLEDAAEQIYNPMPLPTKSGQNLFMANNFYLWYDDEGKATISITGYLLKRDTNQTDTNHDTRTTL